MAKEEEGKKKQRRIKGDAYWKLMGYIKKIKKLQEELAELQQKKAEEAGAHIDLINWNTGAIFADTAEIVNGAVHNGRIVGRLDKAIISEHRDKIKKITDLDVECGAYRDDLAKALNVWPDQIDFRTGKIDPEEFEGTEVPEGTEWEDTKE